MPKQYKLLKDLPNLKAGAIFDYDGFTWYRFEPTMGNAVEYYKSYVENNPEWFEPVDGRWKPAANETYWFVDYLGIADNTFYEAGYGSDSNRLAYGNCFKTKEQAIEAATRIKATLLAYQEELNND